MQDMTFRWKGDDPVSFPSDFSDGYRLPKYVVSFTIDHELHNIYYGEGMSTIIFIIKQIKCQRHKKI